MKFYATVAPLNVYNSKRIYFQANKLDSALNKYLQTQVNHVDNNFDSLVGELPKQVMKCPKCGLPMVLKHRPESTSFISCNGFPHCRNAIWLPSKVQKVELTENSCTQVSSIVHWNLLRCLENISAGMEFEFFFLVWS